MYSLEYLKMSAQEFNQLKEQRFQNTLQSTYPQLRYRLPGIFYYDQCYCNTSRRATKVDFACLFTFLFTDKHWSNAHNRRKFFADFASQKGFDPLVAVNWKNVRYKEMIKQVKTKKALEEGAGEREGIGDRV